MRLRLKFTTEKLIAFTLVVLVPGCVEVIDFPVDHERGRLIVSGQFTNENEEHLVRISRTSTRYTPPEPVSGAAVILKDDAGNEFLYAETDEPGAYRLADSISGTVGRSYYIEIAVNDKLYRSVPEKIPEIIGIDSAYYEITEESFPSAAYIFLVHHLDIYAQTQLPLTQEDYFLRWDIHELYFWELTDFPDPWNLPAPDCFIYDVVNPQKINLLDGTAVSTANFSQFLGFRELDPSFKNKHYMMVRQLSMTRESFEYWKKILTTISNTGSVFDIPPATVPGNIYNVNDPGENVLGYFEACRVSVYKFFLVEGWIPYHLRPYCEYDPNTWTGYPEECLSCREPSRPRPVWF
jgi:hypothetical protein